LLATLGMTAMLVRAKRLPDRASTMDATTLEQLLNEAEIRLYREEQGIVRQRELIASLRRQGRDAADARACLRRLESSQARHMTDRNRLFQALADRSRG